MNSKVVVQLGPLTSEGGFGPEMTSDQIAENLLNTIVSVADTAPPAIKAQALAFKEEIRQAIYQHIKQVERQTQRKCELATQRAIIG